MADDATEYIENPYYTDVRNFVNRLLDLNFPNDGMKVGLRETKFSQFTNKTADEWMTWWETHPGYSTCVDFIQNIHSRICDAKLCRRKGENKFTLSPYNLEVTKRGKGWHSAGDADLSPNSGDLFVVKIPFRHVGIILDVYDGYCSLLAGGGGMPGATQCITRVQSPYPPKGFVGWVDIDEYYNPESKN